MTKPAPSAPASAQDPIESAIAQAHAALVAVSSGLLEQTATSKHGVRSTQDAIADLERGLALVQYEATRQADVAKRRSDRAAVDSALK
jgi:hypothetical protein